MASSIENTQSHGIECLRLTAANGASVLVSRFGAHVLSWATSDGVEQLFVSGRAAFDGRTPIRGGVPVCFPQFSELGKLPKHGFVRNREWGVGTTLAGPDAVQATLRTADDAASRALWPHEFRASLTVKLAADRLEIALELANAGATGFEFTGALHTYFRVDDITATTLSGLEGLEYRDSANGNTIVRETARQLSIDREVDRVYHDVPGPVVMHAGKRKMTVSSTGFPDVVVWNPWIARCAAMADMEPRGYQTMMCIEAAAARVPVVVAPGARWAGSQTLVVSAG